MPALVNDEIDTEFYGCIHPMEKVLAAWTVIFAQHDMSIVVAYK